MEDHEPRIPQPGERYAHYRGGIFEVLVVGRLSEQRDQIVVVYKSLDRGHVWVRPLGMWSEYVEWDIPAVSGMPFRQRAQRFQRITETA